MKARGVDGTTLKEKAESQEEEEGEDESSDEETDSREEGVDGSAASTSEGEYDTDDD